MQQKRFNTASQFSLLTRGAYQGEIQIFEYNILLDSGCDQIADILAFYRSEKIHYRKLKFSKGILANLPRTGKSTCIHPNKFSLLTEISNFKETHITPMSTTTKVRESGRAEQSETIQKVNEIDINNLTKICGCLFFSGHYCVYGVNIQAKCDADCCFLIVSVTAPGKTNDSFAGHLSKLVLKHCLLSILLQWIVLTAFQNM